MAIVAGLGSADGGQVDLEDGPAGELIGEAVGAGVVAGAEQHDLLGAGVECGGEVVVDEAVPQRHVGRPTVPSRRSARPVRLPDHAAEAARLARDRNRCGVRVVDDPLDRGLEVLEGTRHRHSLGGDARPALQPVGEHVRARPVSLTPTSPIRRRTKTGPVKVHLVDGTFELFRCFHGAPGAVERRGAKARGAGPRRDPGRVACPTPR